MKKFLIIFIAFVAAVTSGCLKDVQSTNLLATGSPFVEFEYPAGGGGSAIGTGLEYFGGGALTYPSGDVSDTAVIYANIASTNTLSTALAVTIGPDFKANQDNFANDGITYVNMPDSDYHIVNATQTIPAGQRQATFQIVFYPDKIDPSKNFALPITAISSGNIPVSGNFGHVYFHTIGNPIAGNYTNEWLRWNNATGAGTPAYDEVFANLFAPLTPTEISVTSYNGIIYDISFMGTDITALSDFQVAIPNAAAIGITITAGPSFVTPPDPVKGTYTITYGYNNSAGAARVIIDKFTK